MNEAYLNQRKTDFDWPLLAAAAGLVAVGVFFIFSASGEASQDLALYRQKFFRQIIWCAAGAGAGAAVCLADYGKVARWSRVIYWGAIVSLVAVLVAGVVHKGGRRWISTGSFDLQPSEFAKIAFIFLMADFLSRPVEELRRPRVFFAALGYTALPFVLIWREPDLGSALVFLSICLAMMFVAGVPNRFLGRLACWVGPMVILLVAAILFASPSVTIVKPFQKDRLRSFFGLSDKRDAANYNVNQSLIAVGSGGLLGKGWRHGTQHELGYLPSAGASNDFIFSVIAEEEGFVGSVAVLALYAVLLLSGIKVASQARDRLGQLLAVGVVTLLFSHVFINIGMNIRLMPVAGIPLPLLSYGGSSVVCSLIAIGVLHNVHIYRKSY
ncbi:MAG TPA: rod shape-determining protein RodA [Candidatus Acidoferrum sp.]|nr:rod shape-determining protein RodA [Candidatus Acidoferrum sp.]